MLSIEEIRALGEPSAEFKPILESGNPLLGAFTHDTNIHEIRAAIAQSRHAQKKPGPSLLPYTEKDIEVPCRDGRKTPARIYTPRDVPTDGCPGMIVFHGGGYMVGDLETEAHLCAWFTQLGGIAVNVDYRHAPEHVFPAAIEDAFDATNWTASNAESLGINPAKGLITAGESSGADMALVVAHLCKDSNMSPPLSGIYAAMPAGATRDTIPEKYREAFFSMEQNSRAPVLCAESVDFVRKTYKADLTSPLLLPIAFPRHTGLPKTYFQVCGLDPTRDCGLIMEQVFKDAGVRTKIDVYPGVPHAFWLLFTELEATRKQNRDAEVGLKWLLTKE